MFDDFGSIGDFDPGMPSVDAVPAGGYDAGTLGQYSDLSQGMAPYAPDYGVNYDNPGALQAALDGGVNAMPYAATPAGQPSFSYGTRGLGFTNAQQQGGAPPPVAPEHQSPVAKFMKMPATSDGTATDWSDPKSITQLIKALSAGGSFISGLLNHGRAANAQTAAQLQGQLASNANNAWNPVQAMRANQFANQQYVPTPQRATYAPFVNPVVPSHGYAEGGDVLPEGDGQQPQGPLGLVGGDSMGQADKVDVSLSGGEYVSAADIVSALGDGNNAAGAKIMDKWGEAIRARARSTAPTDNPPPALAPDDYLKGAQ